MPDDVEPPSGGIAGDVPPATSHHPHVRQSRPTRDVVADSVTPRNWKVYLWLMILPILGPFAVLLYVWLWVMVSQGGRDAALTVFFYAIFLWPLMLLALLSALTHSIILIGALVRKRFIGGWRVFAVISLVLSLMISLYGGVMAVGFVIAMY